MIDPIARLMGAAGLAVGLAGLILTAYLWYRSGPHLKVVASVPVGTSAVQIEVMNIGRLAASLRGIELRDHFVLRNATGTDQTAPTSRWAIRVSPMRQGDDPTTGAAYDLAPSAFLRATVDVNAVLAKADGAPDLTVAAWVQRGDGKWYVSNLLKLR